VAKLPSCSADEVVRAFERLGWYKRSQSGSHVVMKKAGVRALVTIPTHRGNVKRGLLRNQLTAAGISVDVFVEALRD